MKYNYPFDPTHGYSHEQLLAVPAPDEPADFLPFWQRRRARAMAVETDVQLRDTGEDVGTRRVFEIRYRSTDDAVIHGWLVIPTDRPVKRGFVIGHGYAGRDAPDLDLPFKNAALLFPVMRGMARSPFYPASPEPRWHVLHNIQDRQRYIIGGCVEDSWLAVSALLRLFPALDGHLGYLGISFGGGLGALALPWEPRIQRAHLNVPTFGNQRLRLTLSNVGSGTAVRDFIKQHPSVIDNLDYFDAAIAARHIKQPMHCALAGFDPFVAPAGQYAIYNALPGERQLFRLSAGHHPYVKRKAEQAALRTELRHFFKGL